MKKWFFWLVVHITILMWVLSGLSVFAQNNPNFQSPDPNSDQIQIMPKVTTNEIESAQKAVQWSSSDTSTVWDRYNNTAKDLNTQTQIVTGVMTWDTILNYLVILLRFLSQIGIVIGSLMFIYVGYQYIMSVITGDSEPSKDLIKNAIIGIIVIIFSYAIMRILTRAFLT